MKNELGEKDQFYDYLHNIKNKFSDSETGKLALRYMIVWKMLENDNAAVVQLSKDALKIMTGEDRKWVLADLAFTYTHAGQLQDARGVLQELENSKADEDLLTMINDDILDVEWQIDQELWKTDEQGKPLTSEPAEEQTSALAQNYPNPGNPTTTIHFHLPQAGHVTLTIFNLMGQKVRVILDEERQAGSHSVIWDGRNDQGMSVSSGVYLYTLAIGDDVFTKKLTLIR